MDPDGRDDTTPAPSEDHEYEVRHREFTRRELLRAGAATTPLVFSLGMFLTACGGSSHTNREHGDHNDSVHSDAAHTDAAHHSDTHHTDTPHVDTPHNDSVSKALGSHGDVGHYDSPPGSQHGDTSHTDTPPQSTHNDNPHGDTPHGDK